MNLNVCDNQDDSLTKGYCGEFIVEISIIFFHSVTGHLKTSFPTYFIRLPCISMFLCNRNAIHVLGGRICTLHSKTKPVHDVDDDMGQESCEDLSYSEFLIDLQTKLRV
jgi:hypothetical protein